MKNLRLKLSAALLAGLCALVPPPAEAAKEKPLPVAQLSAANKAHLKKIETYLDGIRTLTSPFLQISSNGQQAQGTLYLSRPGKMRISYEPPVPVIILANTSYLTYIDTEVKQIQHMSIDDSPASFLLKEHFSFSADGIVITDYAEGAGATRVTLVQSKDPLAGRLTLVIAESPMVLRKWTVVDTQGVVTDVTLLNPRFDTSIPDGTFEFNDRSYERTGN